MSSEYKSSSIWLAIWSWTSLYWKRSDCMIRHWLMIEFKGFLISCDIVELINVRSSPSALELSYNIFYEISLKQSMNLKVSELLSSTFDFLNWKNLNLGTNLASTPCMHLNLANFSVSESFSYWLIFVKSPCASLLSYVNILPLNSKALSWAISLKLYSRIWVLIDDDPVWLLPPELYLEYFWNPSFLSSSSSCLNR